MDWSISEADLTDPFDLASTVGLVDAYASEPIGLGRPLGEAGRDRLASLLTSTPGVFALLAVQSGIGSGAGADPGADPGAGVFGPDGRSSGTGEAIGVAVYQVGISSFAQRVRVNIHDLYVRPAWRGRGVASGLIESVCQRSAAVGAAAVSLEVRSDNPRAAALYERLGFGDPGGVATRFLVRGLGDQAGA